MNKYVLGVDIGSSNIKAIIFSDHGVMISAASQEVPELFPGPNQVEQSPVTVWERFIVAVAEAVRKSSVHPTAIRAMCLDSHRSGCILLDENLRPLNNNMSWRDGRAVSQTAAFKAAHPDLDIYAITGEDGLPQHTVFKLLWLKEERPAVWKRARYVCLSPKDFVLLQILGRRVTSRSIAQSSGLFDITRLRYSEIMLARTGIDPAMLPELTDSDCQIGELDGTIAGQLGLSVGTPVFCGLCDATASQIGTGSVHPGDFAISIGTCGAVRTFLYAPRFEKDHSTQIRVPSPFGYVPSCTVSDAGGVLKWFKDNFCGRAQLLAAKRGVDVYSLLDSGAGNISPGSDGLLLLPSFTGASYAFKNSDVFGAFVGIRNSHTSDHFARAIMEGVAMSLRIVLEKFRENGFTVTRITLGGGGARSDIWVQILADVLNMPIDIPACEESSCLGTAITAALGLKWFESIDQAVAAMCTMEKTVLPVASGVGVYKRHFGLFCKLYRVFEESGFFRTHGEITRENARILENDV